MPDHEHMVSAVHAYVAAFEAGDAEAAARLFAEDATIEDPVGQPPVRGMGAIRDFYVGAMRKGARLKLESEVRTAAGTAAFAFSVSLNHAGRDRRIEVIDTFAFDQAGKVTRMRAYWSASNIHDIQE